MMLQRHRLQFTIRTALLATLLLAVVMAFVVPSVRRQMAWRRVAPHVELLNSADEYQRWRGAQGLAEMGPEAAPAIPALIAALKSRRKLWKPYPGNSKSTGDGAPGEARQALIAIGPKSIPELIAAHQNGDALTRVHAATAHWALCRRADIVLPVLLPAWRDKELFLEDECIRREASVTLGGIGRAEPELVLPLLLDTLQDDDEELVYAAMVALRVMAPENERAIEALIGMLNDEREGVGNFAGWQLRQAGSSAISPLVAALGRADAELRWRAAWTLGGWDEPIPASAKAALQVATQDADEEVRKWSTWALDVTEN